MHTTVSINHMLPNCNHLGFISLLSVIFPFSLRLCSLTLSAIVWWACSRKTGLWNNRELLWSMLFTMLKDSRFHTSNNVEPDCRFVLLSRFVLVSFSSRTSSTVPGYEKIWYQEQQTEKKNPKSILELKDTQVGKFWNYDHFITLNWPQAPKVKAQYVSLKLDC